jgi:acyl dehydratase
MAAKTNPGNFFEDFEQGAKLVHAVPRTITEGDCALYVALTGDRYPLHSSAELARSLGYRRETVNDLLVFHMVFGKTVNDVSLNAVANLGYASVRFLAPVYPGDTVRSISEVLGKKENTSGKNGIVWVKTTGSNQHGETVLEFYRWVMVHKRDEKRPTGASDSPDLPKEVAPSQLRVAPDLDRSFHSVGGLARTSGARGGCSSTGRQSRSASTVYRSVDERCRRSLAPLRDRPTPCRIVVDPLDQRCLRTDPNCPSSLRHSNV